MLFYHNDARLQHILPFHLPLALIAVVYQISTAPAIAFQDGFDILSRDEIVLCYQSFRLIDFSSPFTSASGQPTSG